MLLVEFGSVLRFGGLFFDDVEGSRVKCGAVGEREAQSKPTGCVDCQIADQTQMYCDLLIANDHLSIPPSYYKLTDQLRRPNLTTFKTSL